MPIGDPLKSPPTYYYLAVVVIYLRVVLLSIVKIIYGDFLATLFPCLVYVGYVKL